MLQIGFALGLAAAQISQMPFPVQFAKSLVGRSVTVCIDGRKVERTFAGKLGFRTLKGTGVSVCANVRGPIRMGQFFQVRAISSKKAGGNIAKAGSIVARCFALAQSPDECAGLQLAVWEAIEDGGAYADFGSGRFMARANPAVLSYAAQFYQASSQGGDSTFLGTGNGSGQSQLTVGVQTAPVPPPP